MCLVVSKLAYKRVALKDITVYKQISSFEDEDNVYYVTPYRHAEINIGETYDSDITKYGRNVERGLHSFVNITDCFDNSRWVDKSFYSSSQRKVIEVKPVLVECVIPRGSRYYKGKFDGRESYTSNKLRYVRILKFS